MNPNDTYGLIIQTEYRGIPIVVATGEVDIGLKHSIRRSAMTLVTECRKVVDAKLG